MQSAGFIGLDFMNPGEDQAVCLKIHSEGWIDQSQLDIE